MKFVSITKPGIIFGNLITLTGGFLLASRQSFNLNLYVCAMLGMALIIACGCVLNNCIDRDIDVLMKRTQNRVMVKGMVSLKTALVYAIFLGLSGSAVLYFGTNLLTLGVSLLGLIFYVIVYSLYFKRTSIYGTLVGGIAGAVPPVVGYTAVHPQLDLLALILFAILFLWQVPHFYAISIARMDEFAAARLPILPLEKNLRYTQASMLVYILAFTGVSILPSILGATGWIYFGVTLFLDIAWLGLCISGFWTDNLRLWARRVFLWSILMIMIISGLMWIQL